ncbi:tagatose-bisphosphate aldolase [Histidinibacterium aquaticum]|uniref:Tagatose-bisphosphate aldolase n=1 Tax=Histidinibacterium aquaticum TaxID=2613962 RepID=A0A5J5GKP9_9RHOB|nr:tagatose-bisphosphate aldolase [Histidinibacterium aquaticum]KAA9008052.1 tagatose-bisphosphate aldolase [Histidinibacterium aquaticum]
MRDLDRWVSWRDIQAQPRIWRDWAGSFVADEVRDWIASLDASETWFCGAGSSAHIGRTVVSGLEGRVRQLRSVPTTDIVARPHAYLEGRSPLVVNLGRSGGSPETLGTLDALDVLAPTAPRLNLTCNPDGALAKRKATGPCGVVVLPDETQAECLAMISGFTTMLLTALALFDPILPEAPFLRLADALERLLPRFADLAEHTEPPDRIVFLGTGPLEAAAREAALKVLELTAGQVSAFSETPLGFRHGPKSIVDSRTKLVLFTSGDGLAANYEADLLDELSDQFPDAGLTTVGPGAEHDPGLDLPDVWLAPVAVALAQVLAVTWSEKLGLNVDDPFSDTGRLTRVVQGVTLYPVRPR